MAGTVTESVRDCGPNMKVVSLSCVADAAAATVPDTAISQALTGWHLERVVVNPGGTAPTADSDITLEDEDGVDVLGGAGTNLINNTASKHAFPLDSSVPVRVPIIGSLTQTVANNAVNSATFVVRYIFTRQGDL